MEKINIGDEVFILMNKTIFKSKIEKIRTIERAPYFSMNDNEMKTGIEVDYLVVVKQTETTTSYDWYPSSDVFKSKEDLIKKIV